ncbi:MAG: phosphatase PAP2 family protein [Gemmatimonadetes bacterium]|nr:phosphatase PAP2 family protein [Gemmatimonadota bacterium]MCZ0936228.1 phosphatase PAP2 family protein [Candidatus Palauibacter rhopaloidicola]
MSGGRGGGLLPVDRVAIGYFGCTGLISLAFGGLSGAGIAAAHAIAVFGITRLAAWHPRAGLAAIARGAYAVLLTPLLYAELAVLNRFLTQRYFDATVQAWDAAMFGGQPSIGLSAWLPWLPFSEVLHLGYFAYYAIIPAAILGVFATRGIEAMQRTALAVATAFFVSYLVFMFFPVAGPRYEFAQIVGEIGEGTLFGIVHGILEAGSSKGTAFPSSHIAASLAGVMAAGREDRRWFWLLIIPELALTAGTVYGRFHYAADALAGILLGLLICAVLRAADGAADGARAAESGQPAG